jgi:hypothetical protein
MIGTLNRFADKDLPVDTDTVADLRTFYERWRQQLQAEPNHDR